MKASVLAVLLGLVCLSLASCGSGDSESGESSASQSEVTTENESEGQDREPAEEINTADITQESYPDNPKAVVEAFFATIQDESTDLATALGRYVYQGHTVLMNWPSNGPTMQQFEDMITASTIEVTDVEVDEEDEEADVHVKMISSQGELKDRIKLGKLGGQWKISRDFLTNSVPVR
jgi:hypothetical protein